MLVMSTYEIFCWQIYRLDYPHLIPVKEHRGAAIAKEFSYKFNIANCDFEWEDEVLPFVNVNYDI